MDVIISHLIGLGAIISLAVLGASAWFAVQHYTFKRYARNFVELSNILDAAYNTRLYSRLAIVRVENNGGLPKLGHSIYFTVIDERYSNFYAWRDKINRWRVDRSTAIIISEAYTLESTTIVVDELYGDLAELIKKDNSATLGVSIVYQNRKELYLLLATFDKRMTLRTFDDFSIQGLRIKQLFTNR